MSEPTYRVDLSHRPEKQPFPWLAVVVRIADEEELTAKIGKSREDAFSRALQYVHDVSTTHQQSPSSVYLSEDGDLLDPAEVQR